MKLKSKQFSDMIIIRDKINTIKLPRLAQNNSYELKDGTYAFPFSKIKDELITNVTIVGYANSSYAHGKIYLYKLCEHREFIYDNENFSKLLKCKFNDFCKEKRI